MVKESGKREKDRDRESTFLSHDINSSPPSTPLHISLFLITVEDVAHNSTPRGMAKEMDVYLKGKYPLSKNKKCK